LRLRAVAFDGDVEEIDRLQRAETEPGVTYVAALASLPDDHPFAVRKKGRHHWARNPWDRLSVARSTELLRKQQPPVEERVAADARPEPQRSAPHIVIPRYLEQQRMTSVDFIKIDVDGLEFDILNSFDGAFDQLGVLGVGIEINYFGSASETDHTFHNVDRFMKARGFELLGLTVRRYSMTALPGRYLSTVPARTQFGRPLQGDALYVRDLGNAEYSAMAAALPVIKLVNLICLNAAFGLPDCAADVALRFRDRVSALCDVDRLLDLLAAQAQWPAAAPLAYRDYMRRFEAHDPALFFTSAEQSATGRPREAPVAGPRALLRRQLTKATNRIAALFTGPPPRSGDGPASP
jgi:hypothetical protein